MEDMLEIITDGWPKDNQVLLDEVTCTYMQEPDCTEDREDGDPQMLTLSTRDGGGGKFVHIKTNGWSISDIDDLEVVINDFKKRFNDIT